MITYKLKQINEEWSVFNERVVRMNIDYEISFCVPNWINLSAFNICSLEKLEYVKMNFLKDGKIVYTFKTRIPSISKCDLSKDKFDEDTGVYICETRSEIKALTKVKKVIDKIYKNIKNLSIIQDVTEDKLSERLEKNNWNLERLKGTYEEDTED